MISVFGSDIGPEEISAVSQCMQEQWIGFGSKVEEFESHFSGKINSPNFIMVDSGSNALFLAVRLLDLPPNSKIIVPSLTWVSCAQAVLLAGHQPIFSDVNLQTMNVDASFIEPLMKFNPAAILIVHYAGLPVAMNQIRELGLPVIEDAAHAVDSLFGEQACGTVGDIGIYSFDAVKNLTAGEGGGLVSRDQAVIERAKKLRYCGIGKSGFQAATEQTKSRQRWWEYNIEEPFIKMLPTNIAASIATVQLRRLPELQKRRKRIWDYYQAELGKFSALATPSDATHQDRHSYFTYCLRTENRDGLASYLLDKGIYTTLRYHPLHLTHLYGQTDVSLPNTEELNETALSIPLHPRLSDSEVEYIVQSISDWVRASPPS